MAIGDFSWLIEALDAPEVSVADLQKIDPKPPPAREHVDPGLTVVFLALSPARWARDQHDLAKNARLRDQFNAARLKLGMTEAEVESLFRAKPLEAGKSAAGLFKVYGSDESNNRLPGLHYSNILAVFVDGKLTGVYSGLWSAASLTRAGATNSESRLRLRCRAQVERGSARAGESGGEPWKIASNLSGPCRVWNWTLTLPSRPSSRAGPDRGRDCVISVRGLRLADAVPLRARGDHAGADQPLHGRLYDHRVRAGEQRMNASTLVRQAGPTGTRTPHDGECAD